MKELVCSCSKKVQPCVPVHAYVFTVANHNSLFDLSVMQSDSCLCEKALRGSW